jgi:hypothetical protein
VKGLLKQGNHLVTRVKSNAVSYLPIEPKEGRRNRGRPKLYGKIRVSSLLVHHKSMEESVVNVYGEVGVKIRYCVRDLMWRAVGRLVRFVAVIHPSRGAILLMSTDLTLCDLVSAQLLYERALTIWEKALGSKHISTNRGRRNFATLCSPPAVRAKPLRSAKQHSRPTTRSSARPTLGPRTRLSSPPTLLRRPAAVRRPLHCASVLVLLRSDGKRPMLVLRFMRISPLESGWRASYRDLL